MKAARVLVVFAAAMLAGAPWPSVAMAKCASAYLSVWPALNEPLPANGIIAIEGYGADQEFVRSLESSNPRLVSGERSAALRVLQVQVGMKRLTQAILEPVEELETGKWYRLVVDGRPDIEVWQSSESKAVGWMAGPADTEEPVWELAPVVMPSTYKRYGCGPAIYGHAAVAVFDDGPVRIRVTVTPEDGEWERTYDVKFRDGELGIGHGMCSGAFRLAPGTRYMVVLEAVDTAGNSAPAPGGSLTIIGPERPSRKRAKP